ncbi:MAG: hypothetical protein KAU22_08640, partial [Desulfuromonadales bacterium]|nr:hypothetical protein [Desulfuromonadales bacterium]
MDSSTARFRIRMSIYLLVVVATIATVLVVYLSQLDLNDYRISLEQQLSSALKQPVKIGHCKLTFSRGVAIALDELQIGPDNAVLADVPYLTATLKLTPLLTGQFVLDRVQINNPKIELQLPLSQRQGESSSRHLLNSLGISTLSIHNGRINIYLHNGAKTVQKLALSDFHTVLKNWTQGEVGQLAVSGILPDYGSAFLFETRLLSSQNPEIWRKDEFDTKLQITNFPAHLLLGSTPQHLPQLLELKFSLQGAPATGTTFNTILTSADKQRQLASLSGQWTSSEQQEAVTQLQGKLFNIPLNGNVHLLRQSQQSLLTGKLGTENFTL